MKSPVKRAAHRLDVEGACVMPGLIDGHPYFMHFASFDIDLPQAL